MPIPQVKVLGIKFSQVDDVQKHELGIEIKTADGLRYKYIRAGATIAAGDALKIDYAEGPNDFDPISAVAQPVEGVSPVAIADNYFGWVVVHGQIAAAKMAGSTAAGAKLVSSGTAGTLTTLAPGAAYVQAEAVAAVALAAGRSVICTVAESGGTGTVKIR